MFGREFKRWLGQMRERAIAMGQTLLRQVRERKLSTRQVYLRLILTLALIPTILIGYQNCGPADQFKALTVDEMRAASLASHSPEEAGLRADGSQQIRDLQFDASELGPSPSKSMAMRTIGVKAEGYQFYKMAIVTNGSCSSADFANAHEQDVGDQYLFTPKNNASNQLCAMARTEKGTYDHAQIYEGPTLAIDNEGPVPANGLEDGKMFGSLSQSTSLSWKAASDESGIAHYEVALFSATDHKPITDFVDVGSETSYQFNNLSLIEGGEYYFQVKAYDSLGNWSLSDTSDGWMVRNIPAVTAVRTFAPDGFYTKVGSSIDIEVLFSQLVTVEGVPSLELPIGQAKYVGGKVEINGGGRVSILGFRYFIKAGDELERLDYSSVHSLLLAPGQSIRSQANLMNAALELPAPGAINSLSWGKNVGIDTVAPHAPTSTNKPIFVHSLHASPLLSWTEAKDLGSGIDHYEVAIYKANTNAEILPFKNVGAVLKTRIRDLSFEENQNYYFKVRAVDRAGWMSPSTQSSNWPAKIKRDIFLVNTLDPLGFCAITEDGTLKCWGMKSYRTRPEIIDSGTQYQSVVGNFTHTCGITTSGVLKCWGVSNYTNIGDGTYYSPSRMPTTIDPGTQYQSVTMDSRNTCGITSNGTLKCWGNSRFGLADDGTLLDGRTPAIMDHGTQYQSVSGKIHETYSDYNYDAYSHFCGITSSGVLKCWGLNNWYKNSINDFYMLYEPKSIDSGTQYQSVTVAERKTCGITTDGTLKCGGGYWADQVDKGTQYQSVTMGAIHTCGITTDGTLKCGGRNQFGQLGNGTTTNNNFQETLPTTVADAGTKYQSVTLSTDENTCGITTNGTLKCWGDLRLAHYDKTGHIVQTHQSRSNPTTVDSGTSYQSIIRWRYYTCGLTTFDTVKCWEDYFFDSGLILKPSDPISIDLDQ